MTKPASELIVLADRPAHVTDEISRIKRLFEPASGDKEDLISYAVEVAALRLASSPSNEAMREALVKARAAIWSGGDSLAAIKQIDAALSALPPVKPDDGAVQKAFNLALAYLGRLEPGDSRAVSDEFVAMLAVSCGNTSPEVMAVIDAALGREDKIGAAETTPGLNWKLSDETKQQLAEIDENQKRACASLHNVLVGASPSEPKSQEPDAVAWPPVKQAIWGVVIGENLNDGHYINAYDLSDKLYTAILAHPTTKPEAQAVSVDAIARILFKKAVGSDDWDAPDYRQIREDMRQTATAISALFAGGR